MYFSVVLKLKHDVVGHQSNLLIVFLLYYWEQVSVFLVAVRPGSADEVHAVAVLPHRVSVAVVNVDEGSCWDVTRHLPPGSVMRFREDLMCCVQRAWLSM